MTISDICGPSIYTSELCNMTGRNDRGYAHAALYHHPEDQSNSIGNRVTFFSQLSFALFDSLKCPKLW